MSVSALRGAMDRLAMGLGEPLAHSQEPAEALPADMAAFSESSCTAYSSYPTSRRSSFSIYDCCEPGHKADIRSVRTPEGIVIKSFPSTFIIAAHVSSDGKISMKARGESNIIVRDLSKETDLSSGYPSQSLSANTPGLPTLEARPFLDRIVSEDGTVLMEREVVGRYDCLYPQMRDHPIVAACYGKRNLYCATYDKKIFIIPDGRPDHLVKITLPDDAAPAKPDAFCIHPYTFIRAINLVTYIPSGEHGEPVSKLVVVGNNAIAVIPIKKTTD